MARILVVTQGALASELARGADRIAGPSRPITAISLDWDESPSVSAGKLAAALRQGAGADSEGADEEVLILTDLPGGTPFNIAARFHEPGKVEILSGVNLSMLVRLCCPGAEGRSVSELAEWLLEKGRQSISSYRPGTNGESDSGCD